ncbi:MAG: AAA family ATPase [Proteobacteria bacterium]|nr:AAA family ATPase [Pseudomonadota bacterium]
MNTTYTVEEIVSGLRLENIQPAKKHFASNSPRSAKSAKGLPAEMGVVCRDGQRTNHLTRLVGVLISEGRTLDEVTKLAHDWNSRNQPPADDEKIVNTCDSIWKTDERNHPREEEPNDQSPLFDLEDARVSKMLSTLPPERRWMLKDCLLSGKVGAIVAPGGTGKSQFLLQLGVSVASGIPFLGLWEVPNPGGVLILLAEDDEEEIHFRLHNIHRQIVEQHPNCPDLSKRIEANLYIKSMVAEHNLMTVAGNKGEVQSTGYAQRVVLTAKGIANLELVVVDPASRFRGGVENSAEDVTRFIEELEFIKKHTGATILVAHHANKWSAGPNSSAADTSQSASRGSSAFSDGVRWQMNLAGITKVDANNLGIAEERRHYYLGAVVVKNNYGPPSEPILLERKEGGYLAKANLKALERSTELDLLVQVKGLIDFDGNSGVLYTRSSFEDKYGGVQNCLKVSKNALRSDLDRWVSEGKLLVDGKRRLKPDGPMPSGCPPHREKQTVKQ